MAKGNYSQPKECNFSRQVSFSNLHKPTLNDNLLHAVLESMKMPPQQNGGIAPATNREIPAGFTYFGQFIAHDLATGIAPVFQLRAIYGGGFKQNPKLFVRYAHEFPEPQWLGRSNLALSQRSDAIPFESVMFRVIRKKHSYDVPRETGCMANNFRSDAEMGTAANDNNFIVRQLHCAFLRFHNAVCGWLAQHNAALKGDALREEAQTLVAWHYQWIIVFEYLPKLVGEDLVKKLLDSDDNFKFFDPKCAPHLMPEFANAVMRMGHSQVREFYSFPLLPEHQKTGFNSLKRVKLFASSKENEANECQYKAFLANPNAAICPANIPKPPDCLGDMRSAIVRDDLRMDWRYFFDFTDVDDCVKKPQYSLAINHKLVGPLFDLFYLLERKSLPERDVKASIALPAGLAITQAYNLIHPEAPLRTLTTEQVFQSLEVEGLTVDDLPLWLYILLEAEIQFDGARLGDLGARIMAEQIIWIIKRDASSFLNAQKHEKWQPEPAFRDWRDRGNPDGGSMAPAQQFNILDLLNFPDHFFGTAPFWEHAQLDRGPQQQEAHPFSTHVLSR